MTRTPKPRGAFAPWTVATIALLIVAGNETTRQAISLATLAFAEHPDQWERLRSDPGLVPSATEELLRAKKP